jgi:hypothetical protein
MIFCLETRFGSEEVALYAAALGESPGGEWDVDQDRFRPVVEYCAPCHVSSEERAGELALSLVEAAVGYVEDISIKLVLQNEPSPAIQPEVNFDSH